MIQPSLINIITFLLSRKTRRVKDPCVMLANEINEKQYNELSTINSKNFFLRIID